MRFAFGLCRGLVGYTFGRCTVFLPQLVHRLFSDQAIHLLQQDLFFQSEGGAGRFDVQTSDYTVRNQRNGKSDLLDDTCSLYRIAGCFFQKQGSTQMYQILFLLADLFQKTFGAQFLHPGVRILALR